MARPEGYRKAVRLMEMADRFEHPGAVAGRYRRRLSRHRRRGARPGRSDRALDRACLDLGVPNVALIIGEGGSGGAIAIATANRVLMLEHAIYSVISPEGAASILWRDTTKAQEAATSMKITAQDLLRFGVIDQIVTRARRRRASRSAGRDRAAGDAIGEALRGPEGPRPRHGAARCAATSSWRSAGAKL